MLTFSKLHTQYYAVNQDLGENEQKFVHFCRRNLEWLNIQTGTISLFVLHHNLYYTNGD